MVGLGRKARRFLKFDMISNIVIKYKKQNEKHFLKHFSKMEWK